MGEPRHFTKQQIRVALRDIRAGEKITSDDWLSAGEYLLIQRLMICVEYKDLAVDTDSHYGSVKTQLCNIMKKTGTHSRAELILWAIRRGIVTVEKEQSNGGSNRLQAASGQDATNPARGGISRER